MEVSSGVVNLFRPNHELRSCENASVDPLAGIEPAAQPRPQGHLHPPDEVASDPTIPEQNYKCIKFTLGLNFTLLEHSQSKGRWL